MKLLSLVHSPHNNPPSSDAKISTYKSKIAADTMFYLQKGTWDVLTTRWWARWLLRTDPTAKLCRGRQPWSLSADNSAGSYKGIPELSFDKASKPPGLLLPKLKIAWSSHGKAVDLGVGKVWGSHLTLTDLVSLDNPFSLWASPNVHVDLGEGRHPPPPGNKDRILKTSVETSSTILGKEGGRENSHRVEKVPTFSFSRR